MKVLQGHRPVPPLPVGHEGHVGGEVLHLGDVQGGHVELLVLADAEGKLTE